MKKTRPPRPAEIPTPPAPGAKAYTVAEAAYVLRCSTWTVGRLIRSGELRAVRYGKRRQYVPAIAVDEYLNGPPAKPRRRPAKAAAS